MPVPKRKRSRQRRDKRFANKSLTIGQFGQCLSCEAPVLAHQVCKECGFYKGRKVMTTKSERGEKRSVVLEARKKREEALKQKMEQQEESMNQNQ